MPSLSDEIIRGSQIWKSVFRHPMPVDRRNRIVVMLTNFFLHLHPVSIKKQGIALSFTWCMGGVTFFLFLVETVTGVLLMFYYRPTLEWAYQDILALRDVTSMGILRELHRWGAHAMVITVWLHMYRVFLTGSYKPPREFNWVVGVILLLLTLLLSFTGYLLPWDQLAIWAITVGSNMARATPVLGYEGPGAQLLTVDGIEHDHQRVGRAVRTSGRPLRRRGNAEPLLRVALHRHSAGCRFAAGDSLLASAEGWRHQRSAVTDDELFINGPGEGGATARNLLGDFQKHRGLFRFPTRHQASGPCTVTSIKQNFYGVCPPFWAATTWSWP